MEKLKKTQPDGMYINLSIGSPMICDFVMVYTCNFIQWVVFLAHLNQNICMPAEKCIHFANKFVWCFLSFFLTVANQQKQLSQWCKIQMDEVQTTAHSEEIEEKMAKELLEEGKTSQVILGPMFYLEEELINKKIFERFKGWVMK